MTSTENDRLSYQKERKVLAPSLFSMIKIVQKYLRSLLMLQRNAGSDK